MPLAFLLALQASGMVVDWLGKDQQIQLGKMGSQVEQAGINSNIASSRLEYEDASLNAMKQLRQNMGTQLAMSAARGIRSGTTSTALLSNESLGNFNADERMRKINLLSNQANLKAGKTLSKLHEKTFENNTWNKFKSDALNRIPTSKSAWTQIGEGFSKQNNYGFGITKVGS